MSGLFDLNLFMAKFLSMRAYFVFKHPWLLPLFPPKCYIQHHQVLCLPVHVHVSLRSPKT